MQQYSTGRDQMSNWIPVQYNEETEWLAVKLEAVIESQV